MKQVVTTMQYVFAGVGGFMGWFLGGLDGFLYALLMFVVIDYATGLMAAFVQKKVSSEVGFKGICKKVAIFCLVGIGHVLDTQIIQNGSVLRTAVIFFYLSNEGISIIENIALIGLPVPKKLKNSDVAQSVVDMIPLYLSEGKAEGVRGDIAFAQSCLETGNFGFSGSAVTLDQNNFCGMGVTSNGMKGNSFDTPQLGIRAQIQHLKAYAYHSFLTGTG